MQMAANFDVQSIVATEMIHGGALKWLDRNVQINREAGNAMPRLSTAPLDWNWVAHAENEGSIKQHESDRRILYSVPFQLVLGSDLVYGEMGVRTLPRVIRELLRAGAEGAYALYAHTLNRFEFVDVDFFRALRFVGLTCSPVWPQSEEAVDREEAYSDELFPEQRVVVYRISLKSSNE